VEEAQSLRAAQDDIIAKQTAAFDKAQKKIMDLEARLEKAAALPSAGGPFDTAAKSKADVKELKILREELATAKSTIDAKNRKGEPRRPSPWLVQLTPSRGTAETGR
jgi:hypothetical protein